MSSDSTTAPSEQFKYLGKKYSMMGTSKDFWQDLDVHRSRVAKSALKSHQKLYVIRTYLLPRYLDKLQNPEITLKVLKGTDRLVRIWVRRIVHLNKRPKVLVVLKAILKMKVFKKGKDIKARQSNIS